MTAPDTRPYRYVVVLGTPPDEGAGVGPRATVWYPPTGYGRACVEVAMRTAANAGEPGRVLVLAYPGDVDVMPTARYAVTRGLRVLVDDGGKLREMGR